MNTLSQLSRLCGQRTTLTGHLIATVPLITVSQLADMKTGQALVHSDCMKFVTKLRDYSEYISCKNVELPKRKEPLIVPPIFNVEENLEKITGDALSNLDKRT